LAKQSGITYAVSIDDGAGSPQTISNDVTSVTVNTPRAVQDVTGLDKAAVERLLLLADATVSITGVYNTQATTGSHTVLKSIPSSAQVRTLVLTPLGGSALTMEVVGTNYTVARSQSGELTFTAEFALQNGTAPAWS